MKPQELHRLLAEKGIRIFKIWIHNPLNSMGTCIEEYFWIHPDKTTAQWREDLTACLGEKKTDGYYCATDTIFNDVFNKFHSLGYIELNDVVSDIFEGKVKGDKEVAQIAPDPQHEEDTTGFGHYGWESK